jgi:Bacterial Ig-like domain (group 2)
MCLMARHPRIEPRRVMLLAVAAVVTACGGTATAPDTRTGPLTLEINCETAGSSPLRCTARMLCGLYGCPSDVPTGDLTNLVSWSVDDPTVAVVTGKGLLTAANPGKTNLHAVFQQRITVTNYQRIGVFAGTAPLPLQDLGGIVYDGPNPTVGPIDGAMVQITAGLLQGSTALTGRAPTGLFVSPGGYLFLDVPAGVMTLRVSYPGYVTVDREIQVPGNPVDRNFQIHRSE